MPLSIRVTESKSVSSRAITQYSYSQTLTTFTLVLSLSFLFLSLTKIVKTRSNRGSNEAVMDKDSIYIDKIFTLEINDMSESLGFATQMQDNRLDVYIKHEIETQPGKKQTKRRKEVDENPKLSKQKMVMHCGKMWECWP